MPITTSPATLEVAILNVLPEQTRQFEVAFRQAAGILASADGYMSHELQRCVEVPKRYVLLVDGSPSQSAPFSSSDLVRRKQADHHMEGFRGSSDYQEWKRLLHHFYDPFPTVEHYLAFGN